MTENTLQKQLLLPGIPEKERAEPFLPTKKGGRITAKMMAFVAEYLKSNELAASAIKAGYPEKSASAIANRLVQKSQVSELIQEKREEALAKAGVHEVQILTEASRIAYSSIKDFFQDDGRLKPVSQWTEAMSAAVSSIKFSDKFEGTGEDRIWIGTLVEIKFWDKTKMIELLAKRKGLLKENFVFPDKDGNPMYPGMTIQNNKIVVEFVNSPVEFSGESGSVIEGQLGKGKEE